MASFQFIGNGKSDPQSTQLFGYSFALRGAPVSVDAKAAEKLAKNSHFAEVGEAPDSSLPTSKDELEVIARGYGVELDKRKTLANLQKQVQELIDGDQDAG